MVSLTLDLYQLPVLNILTVCTNILKKSKIFDSKMSEKEKK